MILQTILSAFLLLFPLIRPPSKIGTTNQMQRPMMIDSITFCIMELLLNQNRVLFQMRLTSSTTEIYYL